MGSKDDHLQIPTKDRMTSLGTSNASARRMSDAGETATTYGQRATIPMQQARDIVASWPEAPQKTATMVLDHYGAPNESTPTKLFWYDTGPWSRMELTADELLHNFPMPHTDYMSQYVKYPVSGEKASELARFDGSMLIDRTAGEIGARCDHEPYNTLTLNLAVEIIEGKRSVEDARHLYAETAAAYAMGRDAPYAEGLLFSPPTGRTADPDEAIIKTSMLDQIVEKMKDAVGAGQTPR
jgi:hypothetical protein